MICAESENIHKKLTEEKRALPHYISDKMRNSGVWGWHPWRSRSEGELAKRGRILWKSLSRSYRSYWDIQLTVLLWALHFISRLDRVTPYLKVLSSPAVNFLWIFSLSAHIINSLVRLLNKLFYFYFYLGHYARAESVCSLCFITWLISFQVSVRVWTVTFSLSCQDNKWILIIELLPMSQQKRVQPPYNH